MQTVNIVPATAVSSLSGRVRRIALTALIVSGAAILALAAQKKAATLYVPSADETTLNRFVTLRAAQESSGAPSTREGDTEAWAAHIAAAEEAKHNGDLAEAERSYSQAVREARGFKTGDSRVVESLTAWGRLLLELGRTDRAQTAFEESIRSQESQAAENPVAIAGSWRLVAEAAASGARSDAALQALERARAIYEARLGAYHPVVAETLAALARVHLFQKRYSDAESLFHRALEIALAPRANVILTDGTAPRSVRRPDYIMAAASLGGLGLLCDEQGREGDAERYYRQALETLTPQVGPAAESLAQVQASLGELYTRQKRFDLAEELLKKALATREKALGEDHALVARTLESLAALYRETRNATLSDTYARRAEAIRQRL